MDKSKQNSAAYLSAMHLIDRSLGIETFLQLNQAAKQIVLDTLIQELQKSDPLQVQKINLYNTSPRPIAGHRLSGATRAKPLLLKGLSNPLRVREGDCGNSGIEDVSPI